MSLNHALSACSHSDSQYHNEGGRNHGQSSGNSVDDNFLFASKFVCCQNYDSTYNCNAEEQYSKSGRFLLQWRANIDTKKVANSIVACRMAACMYR